MEWIFDSGNPTPVTRSDQKNEPEALFLVISEPFGKMDPEDQTILEVIGRSQQVSLVLIFSRSDLKLVE